MPVQNVFKARLQHPDTFATTLLAIFVDTYGTEALQWSPQSIRLELQDDFAIQLPDLCLDKLMVGISLLVSNEFFKRLPTFIRFCNILSGANVNPAVFDPADAKECAWGMTEALLLAPPGDEDPEPFTLEIRKYLGKVLDMEGIREAPDLLRLAIRDPSSTHAGYPESMLDDPALAGAQLSNEADYATEIKDMIESNLAELFDELETLPLKNGSTQHLLQRIRGKRRD